MVWPLEYDKGRLPCHNWPAGSASRQKGPRQFYWTDRAAHDRTVHPRRAQLVTNKEPVSRKSRELSGPKSQLSKLQPACFQKLVFLTCFKRKKKQRGLQINVWWLRTPAFQRYKWNCGARNRLEKFRNFWETGPSSQFGSNDALHLRTGRFEVSNSCVRLVFI